MKDGTLMLWIWSIICGWFAFLFGVFDVFLQVLLVFVIIDYITGVMKAGKDHKLSSSIGFKGIKKKVLIFTMVCVAFQLDKILGTEQLRNVVIVFYLSNEGISIVENSAKLGLPIPDKLKTVLEQLRSDK